MVQILHLDIGFTSQKMLYHYNLYLKIKGITLVLCVAVLPTKNRRIHILELFTLLHIKIQKHGLSINPTLNQVNWNELYKV
jgi:hypothetical protein